MGRRPVAAPHVGRQFGLLLLLGVFASAGCRTTTELAGEAPAAVPHGTESAATQAADVAATTPLAGTESDEQGDDYEQGLGRAVRGTLAMRYRRRTGDGEHDDDLYAVVSADVGHAQSDTFTAHVSGRVAKDLDGGSSNRSAFAGLDDTRRKSLDAELYEAYVDYHGEPGLQTVRLGRQWLVETPETVSLDGLLVETEADAVLGSQLGVYGGLPNNEWEASSRGDSLWGAYLQSRPWKGGRVRLDWMHVGDEIDGTTRRNEITGVSVWQNVLDPLSVHGRYTWLDGDSRNAEVGATWRDIEEDLLVYVSYLEQFETQATLVNGFDPFSAVLQAYEPYRQKRLLASKGLGEHFILEAGIDNRDLVQESDAGPFNREFERVHVTGTVVDAGVDGLSVALTAENWDGGGSDQDAWGVDVTDELTDDLRLSVGSYYALFKNDFLLQQERESVRTLYARARYRIDPNKTFSLGYEREDADLDLFSTLTAKMTWRL